MIHKFTFSKQINKVLSSVDSEKNEVLIVDAEICHVGMNGNGLIFTEDSLRESYKTLEGSPVVINLNSKEESDHATNSSMNTVGWISEPNFDGKTIEAKMHITHPEIIEKIRRKTPKGMRELNFVSMGCIADVKCSICGGEFINLDECENGHKLFETHDEQTCGMVATNIEFEHVALTNLPADEKAKILNVMTILAQQRKIAKVQGDNMDEKDNKIKQNEKVDKEATEEMNVSKDQENKKISPDTETQLVTLTDNISVMESKIAEMEKNYVEQNENMQKMTAQVNEMIEEKKQVIKEQEAVQQENKEKQEAEEQKENEKQQAEEENKNKKQETAEEQKENKEQKVAEQKEENKEEKMEAKKVEIYKRLIARKLKNDVPGIVTASKSSKFLRSYFAKLNKQKVELTSGKSVSSNTSYKSELEEAHNTRGIEGLKKLHAVIKKGEVRK